MILRRSLLAIACLCVSKLDARAWIFPEHRDIGRAAIDRLSAESRAVLEDRWKNSQLAVRWCAEVSAREDLPQRDQKPCADFAMLFALAGDHSCSPAQLSDIVQNSEWFPKVARFSAKLKSDLQRAKDLPEKLNVWNASNTSFMELDAQYLLRASGNNAHFPLESLPVSSDEHLDEFIARSITVDAPVNATQAFVRYHLSALSAAGKGDSVRAFLNEAFAIHFLQDLFASGHFAGTWGAAAERKGTHDYYCAKGLVTQTWSGKRFSAHGDAFMTEEDVSQSSATVAKSLQQLADAFNRSGIKPRLEQDEYNQDICRAVSWKGPLISGPDQQLVQSVLTDVPMPSEGEKGVSLPRYRIETGAFISASSGLRFGGATGDLTVNQNQQGDVRASARYELIGRLGVGTTGVLSKQSDGAMFIEGGLVFDGVQYNDPQLDNRGGIRLGIRVPFWILPGDFLILGPFFYFVDKEQLQNIAISASNGGFLGIEKKISTGIGSFQLMAGRQLSVSAFGRWGLDPPRITNADGTLIGTYRSMEFDFPLVEYQPERSFATKLAFSFSVQLGYAQEVVSDVNFNQNVSGSLSGLNNSSIIYLRLNLEGFKYF